MKNDVVPSLLIISVVLIMVGIVTASALTVTYKAYDVGFEAGIASLKVLKLDHISCSFDIPSIDINEEGAPK